MNPSIKRLTRGALIASVATVASLAPWVTPSLAEELPADKPALESNVSSLPQPTLSNRTTDTTDETASATDATPLTSSAATTDSAASSTETSSETAAANTPRTRVARAADAPAASTDKSGEVKADTSSEPSKPLSEYSSLGDVNTYTKGDSDDGLTNKGPYKSDYAWGWRAEDFKIHVKDSSGNNVEGIDLMYELNGTKATNQNPNGQHIDFRLKVNKADIAPGKYTAYIDLAYTDDYANTQSGYLYYNIGINIVEHAHHISLMNGSDLVKEIGFDTNVLESPTLPEGPKVDGKEFVGWYTEDNRGGELVSNHRQFNPDDKLYAGYVEAGKSAVVFDPGMYGYILEEDKSHVDDQYAEIVTTGDKVSKVPTIKEFNAAEHKFLGWYDASDPASTTAVDVANLVVTKTMHLAARYQDEAKIVPGEQDAVVKYLYEKHDIKPNSADFTLTFTGNKMFKTYEIKEIDNANGIDLSNVETKGEDGNGNFGEAIIHVAGKPEKAGLTKFKAIFKRADGTVAADYNFGIYTRPVFGVTFDFADGERSSEAPSVSDPNSVVIDNSVENMTATVSARVTPENWKSVFAGYKATPPSGYKFVGWKDEAGKVYEDLGDYIPRFPEKLTAVYEEGPDANNGGDGNNGNDTNTNTNTGDTSNNSATPGPEATTDGGFPWFWPQPDLGFDKSHMYGNGGSNQGDNDGSTADSFNADGLSADKNSDGRSKSGAHAGSGAGVPKTSDTSSTAAPLAGLAGLGSLLLAWAGLRRKEEN